MTVVLDMTNERNRRFFHMAQCVAALKIEVRTGMVHSRGSVLKLVQKQYGIKARTKAKALEELTAMYHEEFPEVAGTPET